MRFRVPVSALVEGGPASYVVIRFASVAEMQITLDHPKHKAFVGVYIKDRVARIVVYDF